MPKSGNYIRNRQRYKNNHLTHQKIVEENNVPSDNIDLTKSIVKCNIDNKEIKEYEYYKFFRCRCPGKKKNIHTLCDCEWYKRENYDKLLRGELINKNSSKSISRYERLKRIYEPKYAVYYWIKRDM